MSELLLDAAGRRRSPVTLRAFARGDDLGARTAMANGATIARAGVLECVGVNHALTDAVRARFGLAHGRAIVLFLCTCAATCRDPLPG